MLFKRFLAKLLDRPGGRSILGKLATIYARNHTGSDFKIIYRDIWIHRVNNYYFSGGDKFNYNHYTLSLAILHESQCRTNGDDFWFQFYRPSKGDLIIDVGAGRGEDVPAFSEAIGKSGKLLAIEAHPSSFLELERFCKLNRFDNVTLLQMAVMDRPGFVTLTDVDGWECNAVNQADEPNAIRVQADTLDNICKQEAVGEISFLKMNIEGAERAALLGMEQTLRRCKAICVACHDFRADRGDGEQFRTRAFVEHYLSKCGFKVVSRQHDPRDYVRDHIFGLK